MTEEPIHIEALKSVPPPSEKRISIQVTASAQRHVRSGHPWLFENSITKQGREGAPGDLAVIYDRNNKFLAVGLYDPLSLIRVRILQHRKSADINLAWYLAKLCEAAEIRKPLSAGNTDGYRLAHGENDSLPGLIIDRYAETAVVKIYTPSWVPHLSDVVSALIEVIPVRRVVLRMNRITKNEKKYLYGLADGGVVYGPPLEGPVVFRENGILFESDPVNGQKTGFFLDQRENRERVEKLAKDKTVLNVFSYTGGFSLYASRGGAKSVTSVDVSKPAIEAGKRNFELNKGDDRIARTPQEYIAEDAFKAMERMRNEKRFFDMVIIDPPALAKSEGEVAGALIAYARLVKLGLSLLRRGGVLVMASCSSRVKGSEFYQTVFKTAANSERPLEEIERTQHPVDHPIGFPEGAYLKCLFAVAK
ncbi:MAG: class I SAM-dependent rRNA methyltransferase [Nitrospinota bacterium]|nr:class I SAM-dependent rRNA methyltransferase [Nitrospinota bacterium]